MLEATAVQRQRFAPRPAEGSDSLHVIGVEMREADPAHARGCGTELIGERGRRLDGTAAGEEFYGLTEGDRRLGFHSGVDNEEASVGPPDHEGDVAHFEGGIGLRFAGRQHLSARHRLRGRLDGADANGHLTRAAERARRSEGALCGQRWSQTPELVVVPGQEERDEDHHLQQE